MAAPVLTNKGPLKIAMGVFVIQTGAAGGLQSKFILPFPWVKSTLGLRIMKLEGSEKQDVIIQKQTKTNPPPGNHSMK